MADSVHCNHCLKTPFDRTVKYFLTECEKVFCDKCIENNINNCLKCLPNKCRVIELNERVRNDIQIFFKDVTSSFQRLQKVEAFQKSQRSHLIKKLIEENKRLSNECQQQKLQNQNLENELKTVRAQMMANNARQQTNPFDNMFNDSIESKPKDKNLFKDLFKSEAQKGVNQRKSSQMDVPMNQYYSPMSASVDSEIPIPSKTSNQFKPSINPLISGIKPILSPLNSVRKSKIALRPTHPSLHGLNSRYSATNSQQTRDLNSFHLSPMNPMTYTKHKSLSNNSSSNGSVTTPINTSRYPRVSPTTTNGSSITSLSSLNCRYNYLNH